MTAKSIGEKMKTDFKLFLKPKKERPDFRLVITWLWNDFQNTKTDGNSKNPASKDWTELYIRNRENNYEMVNINPIHDNPLILEITGSTKKIICQTAYFLCIEAECEISKENNFTQKILKEDLICDMDNFSLDTAIERVNKSIWRKATLENPYPNLLDDR